jgi:putative DNA methylase
MLAAFRDEILAIASELDADDVTATYRRALKTYLAIALSRLAMYHNTLCKWNTTNENVTNPFAMQTVSMSWDYVEANPFDSPVSFLSQCEVVAELLDRLPAGPLVATVQQQDARSVAVGNPAVVVTTDPPYYDNVGYADLSDFFYIWLRPILRHEFPEFGTLLTPKDGELISDPSRFGGRSASDRRYEDGFRQVFEHLSRVQHPDYPLVFFYAFKQQEERGGIEETASTGWETMLEGLIQAGLGILGTWPLATERAARARGQESNALASSIVLVCRPRPADAGITDRRGFLKELRGHLGPAMKALQFGGVAPVDLAQAAIGPGMGVFTKYKKIVEADGSEMRVRTALALINQVLDEVTAEQEGEFDEDTRWAVAWYTEHGMDEGLFGRADDLSRAKNVSVEGLVRAGIVKSGAGKVRLLDRSELDPTWDPATDPRLTIWEVTQHLICRLLDGSEASAADLLARVGGLGEPARDLAYRLFQIAESKKWAKEAGPYNALAAAWPELSKRAAVGRSVQETLL